MLSTRFPSGAYAERFSSARAVFPSSLADGGATLYVNLIHHDDDGNEVD
jgi:hypothetical protein